MLKNLISWGINRKGQLGHGDTEQRKVPTMIVALEGMLFDNLICVVKECLIAIQ